MIPFTKMHGAGNDFVVLRPEGSGPQPDWASLAPRLCDRRTGIGADGLLLAAPSNRAEVRMRMLNPDGTDDECGNGLRCVALFAYREGLVDRTEFAVESRSGVKRVRVLDAAAGAVEVEMGRADLRPSAVPALLPGESGLNQRLEVDGETLEACVLSTGTAHTVLFALPDEDRFQRLSRLLEVHPAFPERTSVMWAEPSGPDELRVRIWERAAGETLACGTGACAVAAAAWLTGRTGPRVRVASRGGVLEVAVAPDLSLTMTGPAAYVARGLWPSP